MAPILIYNGFSHQQKVRIGFLELIVNRETVLISLEVPLHFCRLKITQIMDEKNPKIE
jgi:hypothetical protein